MWTPIATQRTRKTQKSASIQSTRTCITCTRKITIINTILASKGKFPNKDEHKFVQSTVKGIYPKNRRNLRVSRNQTEERLGIFNTRCLGSGYHGELQNTQENHYNTDIHLAIQQEPQTRGLEGYGSSSSVPPIPQIFVSMEHSQKGFEHIIKLGRTCGKLPVDVSNRYLSEILNKSEKVVIPTGGLETERAARVREYQATIQEIEEHSPLQKWRQLLVIEFASQQSKFPVIDNLVGLKHAGTSHLGSLKQLCFSLPVIDFVVTQNQLPEIDTVFTMVI
ncbi:hypothetical protein O181_025872 [Austropuccinia psidii MF-1]|uniref:Uncharacterized protein n=1 Tax=Austropuccinia psidii MF-1 TaxID=1389203 RepID=A0A9Q3CM25_9BASI|nr:hypothetical protein [Austropuccinia psidii MF-1]